MEPDAARRYDRQTRLPGFGVEGQLRLSAATALIVGAGGLGSASAAYLAGAGLGRLTLIDPDRVELSNLPRQLLFDTSDIGRPKAAAAADRLGELNPEPRVTALKDAFTLENADALVAAHDIVLDGSDNFTTRLTVNAACHRQKKPLFSAAVRGFLGQMALFAAHLDAEAPCYACFAAHAPEEAQGCQEAGTLGPLVGMVGALQALEAVKFLVGLAPRPSGQLWQYDALHATTRISRILRDPHCACCATPIKEKA